MCFRAPACTGALYEIEWYVVTGDLPGLDAGVYHFNPADVARQLLRKGDCRGTLARIASKTTGSCAPTPGSLAPAAIATPRRDEVHVP